MLWLDEVAGFSDAGGKAETLARARRAGLPVLGGFVVLPDEEIDDKDIAARCARLDLGEDARFAVRSSADLEDRPGLSAAGAFETVLDARAMDVPGAVERVRLSAHGSSARAYLGVRGLGAAPVRMAVLVQPMVKAERLGVLHTAPLDEDGAMAAEERAPGEPEWGEVRPLRIGAEQPLAIAARRLVVLVGGEADIEYAIARGGGREEVLILQARPLTTAPAGRDPRRWRPPPGDEERSFSRDAEHNPDPLSAAQASLVDRLAREPGLPRQVLIGGYLFVEERERATREVAPPMDDLARRFAEEIEPACDAVLGPLEVGDDDDPARLDAALAAYVEVARRYFGLVSPSLRAARRALDELLQRSIGEPLASHAALLGGTGGKTLERDSALRGIGRAPDEPTRSALLARYLAMFGSYAPAWDVAVAPDDEAPDRVAAAAALLARGPSPESRHGEALAAAEMERRRVADRMSAADRAALDSLLPSARAAMTLGEDDDALFFRAQRVVRRPLAAIGRRAATAGLLDVPAQIFDLPIDEVRAGAIDAGRARGLRAMREAAARLSPPSSIRRGVATWRGGATGGVLAGLGTMGRAWGRAFVLRASDVDRPRTLPPGAVLVTEAILPSLTYLVPGAAALVTDHGGALCHAATLAREYGVPAVLGTGVATRVLAEGEELLVDGDAGRVFRLGGG